jgi:Flp pilus assembly protein TadG
VVEFALVVPVMLLILLGIADLGRIYTTMMSVESAAREAADFGTTLGAAHWSPGLAQAATVSEMEKRACVAASDLPDYVGDDPSGAVVTCTNPSFSCVITPGVPCDAPDPATLCEDPLRAEPCQVTVTLAYDFHLFTPVRIGLPAALTFERDSTFAMTDIDLTPTPTP